MLLRIASPRCCSCYFIVVVVVVMVSEPYEPAVLEHYSVHDLLGSLLKMQVPRLFH